VKRAVIYLLISFPFTTCLQGQWYYEKYGVTKINHLSMEQLDEARVDTKQDLLVSGGLTIGGGLFYLLFRYGKPGMSEDPGFIEELLGDEGVNKLGMVCSLAIMAGGSIYLIDSMGRMARIKSAINYNRPYSGSLSISPYVMPFARNGSFYSGLTISLKF
jgi:hypothetical protein